MIGISFKACESTVFIKCMKMKVGCPLKVWKSWAAQKGYDESIEKYEREALNKILEEFYSTVSKKDREDYEPDSLRVMATAIDRYLSEKEYKHSIIRDREFKSSKQVLEEKPGNKATRQR